MPLIGIAPVGGSSEAREGQVIWKILTSHTWQERILPLRNGLVPSKPPLYHWLSAVIAEVVNDSSETVIRSVSAISAALLLFVTMSFAFQLVSRESPRHALPTSLLSGFILASTHGFFVLAADARVDMLFGSLVVLACCSILKEVRESSLVKPGQFDLAFFWFFVWTGLAFLAKGPLGIVLPSLIVFGGLSYAYGVQTALRQCFRPRVGWLVFINIALTWYFLAAILQGQAFLDRQLIFENILRFTGGEYVNSKPWWFYFRSILHSTFPYCLLLPVFLAARHSDQTKRARALLLIWLVVGVLFFSMASGKRHSYLLPLFPALSIYLGLSLVDWYFARSQAVKSRFLSVGNRFAFGVCLLILAVMCALELVIQPWGFSSSPFIGAQKFLKERYYFIQSYLGAWFFIGVILSICTRQPWLGLKRFWSAFACIFVAYVVVYTGFGIKSDLKGFSRIAAEISKRVSDQQILNVVKYQREEFFDPLFYYLRREVNLLDARNPTLPPDQFVIARLNWLKQNDGMMNRVEIVENFQARIAKGQSKDSDIIVLFRSKSESDMKPPNGGI